MEKINNEEVQSPSFEIYISGRGSQYDTPEKASIHQENQSPVVITPAKPLNERQKAGRRKLRVAGYCRVSTPSEAQASSIKNQKEHFIKLAAQHDDWNFVGIFADEGISGTYLKKEKVLTKCWISAGRAKLTIL